MAEAKEYHLGDGRGQTSELVFTWTSYIHYGAMKTILYLLLARGRRGSDLIY